MARIAQKNDPSHVPAIMKPVEILKKGLSKLQNQTHDWKAHLQACLQAGQSISNSDEKWLDHDGNLVDEEQLVDDLNNASDYNQRLKRLSLCECQRKQKEFCSFKEVQTYGVSKVK